MGSKCHGAVGDRNVIINIDRGIQHRPCATHSVKHNVIERVRAQGDGVIRIGGIKGECAGRREGSAVSEVTADRDAIRAASNRTVSDRKIVIHIDR